MRIHQQSCLQSQADHGTSDENKSKKNKIAEENRDTKVLDTFSNQQQVASSNSVLFSTPSQPIALENTLLYRMPGKYVRRLTLKWFPHFFLASNRFYPTLGATAKQDFRIFVRIYSQNALVWIQFRAFLIKVRKWWPRWKTEYPKQLTSVILTPSGTLSNHLDILLDG